jgi:hypothetical protein
MLYPWKSRLAVAPKKRTAKGEPMSHVKNASRARPASDKQALFDANDMIFLLLDHQAGLFLTVKDISVDELRRNTITLAKLAALLKGRHRSIDLI